MTPPDNLLAEARVALAAEYEADGYKEAAAFIRAGKGDVKHNYALRALVKVAQRNERLAAALEPFARAKYISISAGGDQAVVAHLTYPADAEQTICLAALEEAQAALNESNPHG